MIAKKQIMGVENSCSIITSVTKSLVFVLFLSFCVRSETVRHYKWEAAYIFRSPDCVEGVVLAINGQFPGPTVEAKVGDTVAVELTNKLTTEGVVIHWHGIRQFGSPWADGTASISQCVINPGETFHYRFKADKAGTYFYHGHYGMQRSAGLYGMVIVEAGDGEEEPFHYDHQFNLLLSDWWHQPLQQQELGLSSNPFRWIGEPQTLLINGRGQFNCSLAAYYSGNSSNHCKLRGREECAPYILSVLPNKTYRLRIASSTSLSSLNLAIGNHRMVVVEADGNYVKPYTVKNLDIYSGETYSVLISTNQNPSKNYWISVGVRGRNPSTPQALTLINYKPTSPSELPLSPPPPTPQWNDYNLSKTLASKILGSTGTRPPPRNHDRRIILLNTQNKINGFIKWAINGISLTLPPTPYLGSIKYGLKHSFDQYNPPENYPLDYDIMRPPLTSNSITGSGVYTLRLGSVVDVILQNANTLTENMSDIHPWHLHGHDFWVLGYGEGKFREKDSEKFNLKNPPLKNTAVIFPHGWTALRFVADNPGVWAFHCHIEPHLHMGMGVVFAEGVDKVGSIPQQALACGLTAQMFITNSTSNP